MVSLKPFYTSGLLTDIHTIGACVIPRLSISADKRHLRFVFPYPLSFPL